MSNTEEPQREKSLHELNMEQRKIDQGLREVNEKAAHAAGRAALSVLNKHRPDGKRTQKQLRAQAGKDGKAD